jgi:hypothetical protein
MSRQVWMLVLVCFAAVRSAAALPGPEAIVVLDTTADEASKVYAPGLNAVLTSYLANELRAEVVSAADVRGLLKLEQTQQLLGCDAVRCAADASLGNSLGTRRLLVSSLVSSGPRLTLSVTLMDVEMGKPLGRAAGEVTESDALTELAKDLVHRAVRGDVRESKGTLSILSAIAGAKVSIDGLSVGETPLAPVRLVGGRHRIRVERDGYFPAESVVEVVAGQSGVFEANLLAKSAVKVAGAPLLPVASAAAGVALLAAGVAGYFYADARHTYRTQYLNDPSGTGVPGPVTKSELDAAREQVEFRGNVLAYYSTWTAGISAGLSAALFTAYALVGARHGGAGDDVGLTADGVTVRF